MFNRSATQSLNRKWTILMIAPVIALALSSCSAPPSSSVITSSLTPDTSDLKTVSEPKPEASSSASDPSPAPSNTPLKPTPVKPAPVKPTTQPSSTPTDIWGEPLLPGFPNFLFPSLPSQPVKPAKPVKPTPPKLIKPTKPVQPTKPVKPAPVVQPTKPVKPTQPTQPVKPVSTVVKPFTTHGFLNFFTRTYAQAFGVYDKGRLENPDRMADQGAGFLKIFRARERAYGSLDLISVVMNAAKELRREIPAVENLQIGDISDKNGGQQGGHGSHQNGLDVDIVYLKRDHREMDPKNEKQNSTGFDEDFVDARGNVTRNFDTESNWSYIQLLVATRGIDRIFVDKHIKKNFCEYAVSRGMRQEWQETLRKLRHWPNHQDHMHVRLECPSNSTSCKTISPIPAGDGCDELLGNQMKNVSQGILRMDAVMGEGAPSDEHAPSEAPGDEHGC